MVAEDKKLVSMANLAFEVGKLSPAQNRALAKVHAGIVKFAEVYYTDPDTIVNRLTMSSIERALEIVKSYQKHEITDFDHKEPLIKW